MRKRGRAKWREAEAKREMGKEEKLRERRREGREKREVYSVRENLTAVSSSVWSLGVPTEASRANSSSSGDRAPTGMCLLPRHTCIYKEERKRTHKDTSLPYEVLPYPGRERGLLLHVTSIGIISVTSW